MSAFLDQQRRKAFEPEPRDWETTRRALIESGMVAESRANRLRSLGIDPAWTDAQVSEYFGGMANSDPGAAFYGFGLPEILEACGLLEQRKDTNDERF